MPHRDTRTAIEVVHGPGCFPKACETDTFDGEHQARVGQRLIVLKAGHRSSLREWGGLRQRRGPKAVRMDSLSLELTFSAHSTRPVRTSRTRYMVSFPLSGWMPSSEMSHPPFSRTLLSHACQCGVSLSLMSRSQQATVGLKEILDFAAGHRECKRLQAHAQDLMNLI